MGELSSEAQVQASYQKSPGVVFSVLSLILPGSLISFFRTLLDSPKVSFYDLFTDPKAALFLNRITLRKGENVYSMEDHSK